MVFCESADQVSNVVMPTSKLHHHVIVALTPEAACACQHQRRDFLVIEDFTDPDQLLSAYRGAFPDFLKWLETLDELSRKIMVSDETEDFSPAKATFWALQEIFSEFFCAEFILGKFLEIYKPTSVRYWAPQQRAIAYPERRQSAYPLLLPKKAKRWGIQATEVDGPPELLDVMQSDSSVTRTPVATERGVSSPLMAFARKHFLKLVAHSPEGIANELRLFGKYAPWRWSGTRFHFGRKPRTAIILGGSWDLDPLVLVLRYQKWKILWKRNTLRESEPPVSKAHLGSNDELGGKLPLAWKALVGSSEFLGAIDKWCGGWNIQMEHLLSHWWLESMPRMWRAYSEANRLFTAGKVDVVLGTELGSDATVNGAVLQAARKARVPFIIYCHGGSGRDSNFALYSYFVYADRVMMYGIGGVERQARLGYGASADPKKGVAVGSARLDEKLASPSQRRIAALRSRISPHPKDPVVLYVPAHLGGYGRMVGDLAGHPYVSYALLQKRVMRIFEEHAGVRLIYKALEVANAHWNPIPDYLRRNVPNSLVLTSTPLLTDLMWSVDLIIVDHVGSALGEVLLTRKPIIVYDPRTPQGTQQTSDEKAMLRKRAFLAEDPESFCCAVRNALATKQFEEISNPDRTYLARFLTHDDNGRSAERAACVVEKVSSSMN